MPQLTTDRCAWCGGYDNPYCEHCGELPRGTYGPGSTDQTRAYGAALLAMSTDLSARARSRAREMRDVKEEP